jgi:uncharacterized OB-fold protein
MLSPIKIWRNQKKIARLIGLTGEIISWTFIRVPPADFSSLAPYPVVLVRLENGNNLMAQMVDFTESDLVFGKKIVTVLRRVTEPNTDGIIPYFIKVKPIA